MIRDCLLLSDIYGLRRNTGRKFVKISPMKLNFKKQRSKKNETT